MKYRIIVLAAALMFLLSACSLSLAEDITPPPNYQSPTPGPTMSPLFPQTPPNLASGAAIFSEKCAPCHGDKGLGDGPMAAQLQKAPSAIGKPEMGRAAAPANWYTTVTQGNINSFMPPFNGSLSDAQRWDVVAYAMSLGGNTPAEAEQGKTVYEANCLKCHGPTGNSADGADLTDQALMAKLTQTDIANFVDKGVGQMPGFGGLIPEANIYAVAAYVRGFTLAAGEAATVQGSAPTATPGVTGGSTATPEASTAATASPDTTGTPAEMIGNISGKVANGSGGDVPSALKAVLHVFEHDTTTQQFSEVSTLEATVADDGTYHFDQVQIVANRAFYVTVNYANTDYQSDPVFPQAGQTSFDLPVTIYDTTTDLSGLVADQVHILLDYSKPDVVQVVEFLIFSNPGTKSIVAAKQGGPVVSVSLPKGYTNLQFEQGAIGDPFLKTDDGFADTTTVTPGTSKYQIVFAVDLPLPKPGLFGGSKLEFTQPFSFAVNGLSVLAPQGVTVEGKNFTPAGLQDIGTGEQYQIFNSGAVQIGSNLQFTASGGAQASTAAATTGTNSNQNIIIGVGAFGLVLIVAGVWMYWRDRRRAAAAGDADDVDDEEGEESGEQENENMDEIMDAIMALDDQFKAGNIKEAAYQERRAELKAKLKNLL